MRTPPKDTMHLQHRLQSLDLHEALCRKLRDAPELIEKLRRQNIFHIKSDALRDALPYSLAWKEAINKGVDAVIDLALLKGEYGDTMRSCSHFRRHCRSEMARRFPAGME